MSSMQEGLIFLIAAVLIVPFFRKLGLGTVLGYLAAGSLIGPQITGLIKDYHSVQSFAEFGVVFLLFMIGLELQPKRLWAMKKTLIGFGGLQILLCSVVFAFMVRILGLGWAGSFIVGFSLSLSSTAFALQTLSERKILNTEIGRSAFAVLLMQDVAAIPALAVIPSLGVITESTPEVNWLGAVLLVVILVASSRFSMRRLLRMVAGVHSRELFTSVTLLIVMGVAYLMSLVGLSMALGAFIAGVLLSESEYRHELEADLEPFRGLLMGLFFISVGMSVNFSLLITQPLRFVGLTLAYVVFKFLLIMLVGRVMHLSTRASRYLAVYLVQGGEFAYVIFGVGLSSQVIPAEWTQQLTLVVTMSMIVTPFVIALNDVFDRKVIKPEERPFDTIEEQNPVIIAGFGRVGQIFGRVLRTQNIGFTAIDHDSEQVELIRRFGNKVYFGDASRKEILEMAGAARAKYFVLAVDDVEASVEIAKIIKENFPHLKIYARARNRQHVYDLMDLGLENIKRETFDSSVNLTETLLRDLGYSEKRAQTLMERFRVHDEIMVKEQFKVRHDEKVFLSVARQGAEQLARVLKEDSEKTYIDLPN